MATLAHQLAARKATSVLCKQLKRLLVCKQLKRLLTVPAQCRGVGCSHQT